MQDIKKLVKKYEKKIIGYRRYIHENPELSSEEEKTAAFVASELLKLGIDVQTKVAKTGVVGTLKCGTGGRTIALRADMDALPIQEETNLPFKSKVDGVMHACGHDGHTAIILGVANILSELKDEFNGIVKFIFQPAEEFGAGGRQMVEAGAVKDVDLIVGLHAWADFEVGKCGIGTGYMSGGCETVNIRVLGKSAHTSTPEAGVDAMYISAKIIDALYSLKSLNANAYDVYTLTITRINGGKALNVLTDSVYMQGLLRYSGIATRDKMNRCLVQAANLTAEAHGGKAEVEIIYGYPPMKNPIDETERVKNVIAEVIGDENILNLDNKGIGLALEDFAYYQQAIPGVFFLLGAKKEGANSASHTKDFDIDESALAVGAEIMTKVVLDYFN